MRSLRSRLSLGVALVIAAVLGVSGVLISDYAERTARESLDDRLRRTAELSRETALAAVERRLPDNDRRLDAVLSATGTSLRLLLGEAVLLDYGTPKQRAMLEISVDDAEAHLAEGQFPEGSMGPKIQASIAFLRAGGRTAVITNADRAAASLEPGASGSGTRVVATRQRLGAAG